MNSFSFRISFHFFQSFLGFVYLVAFLSLWVQITGLVGSGGISPVGNLLQSVSEQVGSERYWYFPTLFWFSSSDAALHVVCGLGAFFSVVLIVGVLPKLALIFLWVLYLSLVTAGREFLGFQWDNLLLEAGFLAIFIAPLRWRSTLGNAVPPHRLALVVFWFLLFKLIFSSGAVKLSSGDLAWRGLAALDVHYETQPLPTWLGWYAHQLPRWFQRISVLLMFLVELIVPFFILAPRKLRLAACGTMIGFQGLILLTGNYCFFNWLTIGLCMLLIDDHAWPKPLRKRAGTGECTERKWTKWIAVPLAVFFLVLSTSQVFAAMGFSPLAFHPIRMLDRSIHSFRSVNGYGLFASMTTSRPEIVVEGSDDGRNWLPYALRWKPQDVALAPKFVAPHQPRLDWQLWFAALTDYRANPWFIRFLRGLLQGKPAILRFIADNPFPDKPPRFIRAALYDYRFTDWDTKRSEGAWWRRERQGLYCSTLSLDRM